MRDQKEKFDYNQSQPLEKTHIDLKKIDFNHLLNDSLLQSSRQVAEKPLPENQEFSPNIEPSADDSSPDQPTLNTFYEEALREIQQGNYASASEIMQKAIFIDLDSRLPSLMVKTCDFWDARLKKLRHLPLLELFPATYEAWLNFYKNIVRSDTLVLDRVIHVVRMQVFGNVIEQLKTHPRLEQDAQYAFALARAYKYRGDYDEAIDIYALVLELDAKNPSALAELADCYAIIDEEGRAKILFREAFFHGADRILMDNLESVMIKQLRQKTRELHLPETYLAEWMAVYGVVFGLFDTSRELSNSEYARLNHSIHALRAQVEEHPEKRGFLVPRLIYRLFWLIDYFVANQVDAQVTRQNIEKVLFEIKFLDERVYKKYKL
ncbi:tetratricopeptide repeat protein [Entomospira culicis]|uniref:Tetratricopeptide repeat protein n=1 Tax=Entomospira culicis TaxID=2719989 RepID=A0A968GES7_9SPIO|nr:hypothetical protein [Entomospira culicis]NIZ18497.1 hypothetical protein [Entomospira culicis]NIZ68713.1 hypothetical protein [Entomospira culicis]WDI37311.1 hypothetical protein PVA46_00540 [Entomospira culicis]WDI38940.1 hypothetical protein PVA47_00550 [Entomospira culicis]